MMAAVLLKAGIPVVPHRAVDSSIFSTSFVLLIKQLRVDMSKNHIHVLLSLLISRGNK